jgi:predicted nucleotidyltransferase
LPAPAIPARHRYTDDVLSSSLLEAAVQVAAADPEIRALYVFGSQLSGHARSGSDLDLGVLYRHRQPLASTLTLEDQFEPIIGRRVDVVDVARASAFLALDIVRGERVFCRDSTETDRFELYVLRRAGDLLPFERDRQALLLNPPAP